MNSADRSDNVLVKVEVFQFIKWEERHKYFNNVNYPKNGEYDLLHFHNVKTKGQWGCASMLGFFRNVIKDLMKKGKDKDNGDYPISSFLFSSSGAIWVKRPHQYKKGDILTINADIISREVGTV